MNNISKERIDEVFMTAIENNLFNLKDQFQEAIERIPEQKENSMMRELIAANLAQNNAMLALKEIFYELFTEDK